MIQSNEEEEKRLPQDVQLVLRGKRSLVWRRLLRETCYPDMGIVSGVVEGLKLVGSSTKSNAFPSGLYLAQQTVEQLSLQSIWRRRSKIGKCQASDDAEAGRCKRPRMDGSLDHTFLKKKFLRFSRRTTGSAPEGSPSDSLTGFVLLMMGWRQD